MNRHYRASRRGGVPSARFASDDAGEVAIANIERMYHTGAVTAYDLAAVWLLLKHLQVRRDEMRRRERYRVDAYHRALNKAQTRAAELAAREQHDDDGAA